MKAFQQEMNKNREETRQERWKEHRSQVMSLFDQAFTFKPYVDKIAIFGAGNGDDLQLNYLATKCNAIYLFE